MHNNENKLIFSHYSTIRWQDMDAFGHVNHSNYFVYMQECRIAWLRSHQILMDKSTRCPIISEASCKYLRPITYPAEIVTSLYFNQRRGRRIIFEQTVCDKNAPEIIHARAQITVVWIDLITGKSIPEPEEYRYILD